MLPANHHGRLPAARTVLFRKVTEGYKTTRSLIRHGGLLHHGEAKARPLAFEHGESLRACGDPPSLFGTGRQELSK